MVQAGTSDALPELNLLRQWREPISSRRVLRDAGGSLAVHALIAVVLLTAPGVPSASVNAPGLTADFRKSVPLFLPKDLQLTQKDPNKGKVSKELDVRSAVEAPRPQTPRVIAPSPPPGPVVPRTFAPAPRIEPPKIEPPKIEAPKIELAESAPPPPPSSFTPQTPPAPPVERPKLAFERIGGGTSNGASTNPGANPVIKPPDTSVSEAVRAAIQPGGGGLTVGDVGDDLSNIPSLSQPPAPGRMGSNLQLLSDPSGVDFKPYLIQVLALVRRNWMAIIPESARMGRRGRVSIQFIIDRRGAVPKLVIATPSGTEAFDRAAVAGISASNPFPPLPNDYKGEQIRLQLAFSYNVPAR